MSDGAPQKAESAGVPAWVMTFADLMTLLMCFFVLLLAFSEMVRVSSRNVIISLPDAKILWKYHFHLPKIGRRDFLIPRPAIGPKKHLFDGEHYWEVNKRGYSVARVIEDLEKHASLVKTYRAPDNLNHRFFIFELAR